MARAADFLAASAGEPDHAASRLQQEHKRTKEEGSYIAGLERSDRLK
jgi:hypothetical protein